MARIIAILIFASALSGCASWDKEKAAEQRKQELCQELPTRDQPQCTGAHVPTG